MPIYRISAQSIEGILIDPAPPITSDQEFERHFQATSHLLSGQNALGQIIARAKQYKLRPKRCEAGVEVFSPSYLGKLAMIVEVHDDRNSATAYTVSRSDSDEIVALLSGQKNAIPRSVRRKGIEIPADQPFVPLLGPIAGDKRLRLHEVIYHQR